MTSGFDVVAPGYDSVALSALGLALRARVHERLRQRIAPGSRMLDLGCGTGLDAAFAAELGATVTAIDASAHMVERCRARLAEVPGQHVVAQLDLADRDLRRRMGELLSGSPDVVLSNFGAINCLPELVTLGGTLADRTVPGTQLILVVMGRWVPWEQLPALARNDRMIAGRRHRTQTIDTDTGHTVRYPSSVTIANELGSAWRRVSVEPLGTALPTYERRSIVQSRPRALAALDRTDRILGGVLGRLAPQWSVGDHQIIEFERRR